MQSESKAEGEGTRRSPNEKFTAGFSAAQKHCLYLGVRIAPGVAGTSIIPATQGRGLGHYGNPLILGDDATARVVRYRGH